MFVEKLLTRARKRGRKWYASVTAPADSMFGSAETGIEKAIVGMVKGGLVLGALMPFLLFGLILVASSTPTFAQTPGGDIFGASNQTVGNGVRAFCKWFRVLVFFAGVIAFGACGLLKIFKVPCAPVFWGSLFCFGFAGIAQLVYSFSNGQDVEFNPDLN